MAVVLDALNQGVWDDQALSLQEFGSKVNFFFYSSILVFYFLPLFQKGGSQLVQYCLSFLWFCQSPFLAVWQNVLLLYSPLCLSCSLSWTFRSNASKMQLHNFLYTFDGHVAHNYIKCFYLGIPSVLEDTCVLFAILSVHLTITCLKQK